MYPFNYPDFSLNIRIPNKGGPRCPDNTVSSDEAFSLGGEPSETLAVAAAKQAMVVAVG